MRYLTRVRLGRAAGYLATSDKTLHEIARLVGYDNAASLSKAFHRGFGSSPGAFRREQLAAPALRTEFSLRGNAHPVSRKPDAELALSRSNTY